MSELTTAMGIFDQLKRDEGLRLKPYKDSVGKLTIGYGRNLDDKGISQAEAEQMLHDDVRDTAAALQRALPWSAGLDDARLGVLLNMAFNMGVQALILFRNTLALIQAGDYDKAADEMLKSKWAAQVGPRAHRLALQMRSGEWQ